MELESDPMLTPNIFCLSNVKIYLRKGIDLQQKPHHATQIFWKKLGQNIDDCGAFVINQDRHMVWTVVLIYFGIWFEPWIAKTSKHSNGDW